MTQGTRLPRVLIAGLLLISAAFILGGCASAMRAPEMTPFTRGVLLIYDGPPQQCARKKLAEALLYLELEPTVSRTVTVRAFNEKNRPMALDPKSIKWSTGANITVFPERGSATVKVTLLGGDGGPLKVEASNHTGQLQVRKKH
jgi:hypothetical protein